jgi:hypothetical protein
MDNYNPANYYLFIAVMLVACVPFLWDWIVEVDTGEGVEDNG